jgi:hypothetical protein
VKFAGNITGKNSAGGIVGGLYRTDVTDFQVLESEISGSSPVGGAFGSVTYASITKGTIISTEVNGAGRRTGGIAGHSFNSNFSEVEFKGEVVSAEDSVGGAIGYAGGVTLTDVKAQAYIEGDNYLGGLIGDVATNYSVNIMNSLAISEFSGSSYIGTMVGRASVTTQATSSFWDSEVSGLTTGAYGAPKTTSELQCPTAPGDVSCDPTLFADWDATVWDFGTSSDYPVLR